MGDPSCTSERDEAQNWIITTIYIHDICPVLQGTNIFTLSLLYMFWYVESGAIQNY